MKVVLELQDQPSNVRRVTVRHDIVIGRGADCNLRLSSPQISRRHCFLRVGRDGVSVTDLDSSNGTFVDGQRLTSGIRQVLVNGSQLSVGPVRFVVHVREEAVSNEILKPQEAKGQKAASQSSEQTTVVAGAKEMLRGGAMNLALEQAGASADSRDMTSDFLHQSADAGSAAQNAKQRAAKLPSPDSRAEIVDLGRQLLAEESAQDQKFDAPATKKRPAVPSTPPPASPAAKMPEKAKEIARSAMPLGAPSEDHEALEDLSFFGDSGAHKTITPLNQAEVVDDEVYEVAEVVEELPDEVIEIVDEVTDEPLDLAEVVEYAEAVEEVDDVVEVSAAGNVLSLDDDWDDPDERKPQRRKKTVSSQQPMKLSTAARGSAGAKSPAPAKKQPPDTQKSRGQTAASATLKSNLLASVPDVVEVEEAEIVDEVYDEVIDVVEVADVEDVIDVETVSEAEIVDEVEEVEVVDVEGEWFEDESSDSKKSKGDDNDIDPNLANFLKGL